MISLQKKFLFIHVPKTAGNSIQNILKYYSEDEIITPHEHQDGLERFEISNPGYKITKHSTLAEYQAVLDPATYRSLFKFSTIRNPWDRLISFYFSPHRGAVQWDRNEFTRMIRESPLLRHYLCLGDPQSRHIDADVDFILKFEQLEKDFTTLAEILGLPITSLPRRNASVHAHYSSYYDDELVDMVAEKFAEEIDFGSYKFETA